MSELQTYGGPGGRGATAGGETRGVEPGEGIEEGGGQAAQEQAEGAGGDGVSLQRVRLGRAGGGGPDGAGGFSQDPRRGGPQEDPGGQGLLPRYWDV